MKLPLLFLMSIFSINVATSSNEILQPQLSFKLCYQNVFGQPPHQDIETLWFELSNNQISGEFNWFPALQYERTGHITGTMHKAVTAYVIYTYQENNQTFKTQLTFSLSQYYIFIQAKSDYENITTVLKRVSCSALFRMSD